ncbi:PLD nuclease N-terminal domain-containing protein [Gorillibacterium sp. CAU 1737]|uniref:PLD nuclease N-terminal domain-containing protein n=1 Tax=Gorillibacterium sp. CAU 1737 TaxID=3140362 RepID=UPI0032605127
MKEWNDMLGFDWRLLLPLVVLQLILMIIAGLDLLRQDKGRICGPKWAWALVIVFGELIGPVVYFVAGRRND